MRPGSGNILFVDKPKGITSFDVIRILRKKLGMRKMGHAGTLDPLASGLMIVGVQEGTKRLKNLIKLPKVYDVEILLGVRTASGDMEGEILETNKVADIDTVLVKNVLESLVGKLELSVPLYSAVKVAGRPLYKIARSKKYVHKPRPPRKTMEVISAVYKGCRRYDKGYIISAEFEVSSGTYIRSVAEEFGRRIKLPAVVKELRRVRIGAFDVSQAMKL